MDLRSWVKSVRRCLREKIRLGYPGRIILFEVGGKGSLLDANGAVLYCTPAQLDISAGREYNQISHFSGLKNRKAAKKRYKREDR